MYSIHALWEEEIDKFVFFFFLTYMLLPPSPPLYLEAMSGGGTIYKQSCHLDTVIFKGLGKRCGKCFPLA